MKKRIVTLQLNQIQENFMVRVELNRDHVDHLKDLIGAGVVLDPILVSEEDKELIDGRHRKAAYLEMAFKEVECEARNFASDADKIVEALRCNVGGSLPPTHADVNHTMQILLASGATRKTIIEIVSERIGFPPKLIARHLDEVQSNMAKARLKKAAYAVVNDGKTVHEAAAEQGVNLETLRRRLKADGETDDDRATSVNQAKSYLSTSFASLQHSQGQVLSKVLRELKDGLISPEESQILIDHVKKLTLRLNRHHDEWVKRFASHIGVTTEALETAKAQARQPQVSQGKKALARMGIEK